MRKKNEKKIIIIALLFVQIFNCKGQTTAQNRLNTKETRSNIIYIELPKQISKQDFLSSDFVLTEEKENSIREKIKQKTESQSIPKRDFIIIYTKNGDPILPDYEKMKGKKTDLSQNELRFTFESPEQQWTASEIDTMQKWLSELYPIAKNIYGSPAYDITVNIIKDNSHFAPGSYGPSSNEITIRGDLTSGRSKIDVLCHEMLHAFRDDNTLIPSFYEEGMVRAAEIEVFHQSKKYNHPLFPNHNYTYDIYYEALNQPTVPRNFFNCSKFLGYQLSSYAWIKPYFNNKDFFKKFNKSLNKQLLTDPSADSEENLKKIIKSITPKIEHYKFDDWYANQHIFNTKAPEGYYLYQRINQFTIDYYKRDTNGQEVSLKNSPVKWYVYDYENKLLDNGIETTNERGIISFYPSMPEDYYGRIKLKAVAKSPKGKVINEKYRFFSNNSARNEDNDPGVFGVVDNVDINTITITPLDSAIAPLTKNIVNGAFSFPSLKAIRGCFQVSYTDTKGNQYTKYFNKDASDYHYILRKPPVKPSLVAPINNAKKTLTSPLFQWNQSDDAVSYRLQVSTDQSFSKIAFEKTGITDTTYHMKSLKNNRTYYWRLKSSNEGKASEWSNIWRFSTTLNSSNRTGLKKIYPNPFSQSTTIEFILTSNEFVELDIHNMRGKLIETLISRNLKIGRYAINFNAKDLATGFYLCRLKVGNYAEVEKMLIAK